MPRAAIFQFVDRVWVEIKEAIVLRNILQALCAVVLAGLMLTPIVADEIVFGVPPDVFTIDLASIANLPPLSGALSNLGVLLWCASMSICLFSAFVLKNVSTKDVRLFLAASGLLSGYLLFDDLFQFHEFLAQKYLGIRQVFVVASIILATASYLIFCRRIIMKTNILLLTCALGFLALSVAVDQILEPHLWRLGQWSLFVEDGAKWIGIFCWFAYLATTAQSFMRKAFAGSAAGPRS